MPELDEVVDEADRTASERDEENRERRNRVGRDRQVGRGGDTKREQPTHDRRPLLRRMALRHLLADVLSVFAPAQERDEPRPGKDRDEHRGEARDQNADHF